MHKTIVFGVGAFLLGLVASLLLFRPTPPKPAPRTPTVAPSPAPSAPIDAATVESLRERIASQDRKIAELVSASIAPPVPEKIRLTPEELEKKSARVADLWTRSYRQTLSKEENAEMMTLYAEIDGEWAPYFIDLYKKRVGRDPLARHGMMVLLFSEAGGPEVSDFVARRLSDAKCTEEERQGLLLQLAGSTASYRELDKLPTTPELSVLAQGWLTSQDRYNRAAGARLLGGIDTSESRATLMTMLADPDWSVRTASMLALGRAGDLASLRHLLDLRRSREGTWQDSNESRAERKGLERAIRKLKSRLEPK